MAIGGAVSETPRCSVSGVGGSSWRQGKPPPPSPAVPIVEGTVVGGVRSIGRSSAAATNSVCPSYPYPGKTFNHHAAAVTATVSPFSDTASNSRPAPVPLPVPPSPVWSGGSAVSSGGSGGGGGFSGGGLGNSGGGSRVTARPPPSPADFGSAQAGGTPHRRAAWSDIGSVGRRRNSLTGLSSSSWSPHGGSAAVPVDGTTATTAAEGSVTPSSSEKSSRFLDIRNAFEKQANKTAATAGGGERSVGRGAPSHGGFSGSSSSRRTR